MKKKFIIAGNWKMNPTSLKEAKKLFASYTALARKYPQLEYRTFVPSVFLHACGSARAQNTVVCGAQNVYFEDQGSYTGAVSIPMVQDSGAVEILIGHSERRTLFGLSEEVIGKKIAHAMEHNMPMTVCFGERARDGGGAYLAELERQIETIISPFKQSRKLKLLTLAYEPVWAIGAQAKRPVTSDELFSTLLLIRNIITTHLSTQRAKNIPLLYGGSVNPLNAQELSQVPGVDGFLIGRASLDKASLAEISNAITD